MIAPRDNLLDIKNLGVSFGGIEAVKSVDLTVKEGEVVAIIGANGAGKTTTLKAITGTLAKSTKKGEIFYLGKEITNISSFDLPKKGLVMVPEGRNIFTRMNVKENLLMGAFTRTDNDEIENDIEKWFSFFPRLEERKFQSAGLLSGGEQQMLALSRALMSKPKLLLLDEPSMGLAPIMVELIFDVISQILDEGVTILIVEQNIKQALKVASRGYVMENGVITITDSAQKLLNDERVQKAYRGG